MGDILPKRNTVEGFRKNDPVILKDMYLRVYPKVRRFVLNNSGDDHDAKDIFQEAFISCWRNIKEGKVDSESHVEAYLFTIAKNKWTDYLRSAAFKKTVSASELAPWHVVTETFHVDEDDFETNRRALKVAFTKLGAHCKRLLNLYYFERKSMAEISEALGITSASARNQKYRCMEKLRMFSIEIGHKKMKNHG